MFEKLEFFKARNFYEVRTNSKWHNMVNAWNPVNIKDPIIGHHVIPGSVKVKDGLHALFTSRDSLGYHVMDSLRGNVI